MAVLRETLLATQGLDLGPAQKQGPEQGQEFAQEEKQENVDERARGQGLGPAPDASVTRASLPAHQWRSVCAMLQLRQRHPPHAWNEGEASVPGEIT